MGDAAPDLVVVLASGRQTVKVRLGEDTNPWCKQSGGLRGLQYVFKSWWVPRSCYDLLGQHDLEIPPFLAATGVVRLRPAWIYDACRRRTQQQEIQSLFWGQLIDLAEYDLLNFDVIDAAPFTPPIPLNMFCTVNRKSRTSAEILPALATELLEFAGVGDDWKEQPISVVLGCGWWGGAIGWVLGSEGYSNGSGGLLMFFKKLFSQGCAASATSICDSGFSQVVDIAAVAISMAALGPGGCDCDRRVGLQASRAARAQGDVRSHSSWMGASTTSSWAAFLHWIGLSRIA